MAFACSSCWTRTSDPLINSQMHVAENEPSVADTGHLAKTPRTRHRTQQQDGLPTDPELAVVAAAWDDLPAAVRVGIAAMVRASGAE